MELTVKVNSVGTIQYPLQLKWGQHRHRDVVTLNYGCSSFLAARIPCVAVSLSHMYAPSLVFP
jgi:hypothetical protein